MAQPQPLKGAIVRAERFCGVAMGRTDDGIIVVPAVKGPGLHRSDVSHDEPFIPSSHKLRTGDIRLIQGNLTVTGRVSDATMAAINVAMAREAQAIQFESRFPAHPGQTERAVRM
jgi:hypothetical protein